MTAVFTSNRRALVFTAVAAALAAACAPSMPDEQTTPVFEEEDDAAPTAGDALRADAAPAPDDDLPSLDAGGGRIDGVALDEVLDAGPGAFLSEIEVRPVFADRAFRGWEILAVRSSRLQGTPLRRGDLVTRVNQQTLRRPEDLQTAWDELRAAPALVVEGERAGRPFTLRYDIER